MNIAKKQKGFTIIEVVLVLAIAGLIFMMVFIAYPAVLRTTHDSARKTSLVKAKEAIASYAQNNRGNLPTLNDAFIASYLTHDGTDPFIDPSGANTQADPNATTYKFTASGSGTTDALSGSFSSATNQNVIYYTTSAVCGNNGGDTVSAGNRMIALRMYLEGGGITCLNN